MMSRAKLRTLIARFRDVVNHGISSPRVGCLLREGPLEEDDSTNLFLYEAFFDTCKSMNYVVPANANGQDYDDYKERLENLFRETDCEKRYREVTKIPPVYVDELLPVYMLRHLLYCKDISFAYNRSPGFSWFVRQYKGMIL